MKLKRLTLSGFRNLKKIDLLFDDSVNTFAFCGLNGQGKTNVLECIFLLAISKSFRTNENLDFISFDADFCRLSADYQKGDETNQLELIITREPARKVLKVNGVQKKALDFIGHLNVVFFSPDDIGMIHSSPSVRRRYLDLMLSQYDREYLKTSLDYQQAVKQRNSLLKLIEDGRAQRDELAFWDDRLVKTGTEIMKKRAAIIDELTILASIYYSDVSSNKDVLRLNYQPSIDFNKVDRYSELLSNSLRKDLLSGSTQLGPHRDDLSFMCNEHDMKSFASRGEWRSLVLSLKLSEIELLRRRQGFNPILLLDDVFSELDDERQKVLFNMISGTQTFITTTHTDFLKVIEANKAIFNINGGLVQ